MNRHMRRRMQKLRMLRGPNEIQGMESFGDPNGFGQGNFGGQGGGQQPNQQGGNQGGNDPGYGNTPGPLFGQEEDDSDKDIKELFEAFAPKDGEEDDDGFQPMEDIPPERISEMQTNVANQINNMQLPENFLPPDFDPSNPQQLNQAFRSVMQHTLRNALNVVFQPTQLAMQSMSTNFQNMVNQKFADTQGKQKESQILESEVPEINDPQYASMLKAMDSTLKSRGKAPAERAKTLRKMLNQMGVTPSQNAGQNRRTSSPNQGPSGGITTGHTALDKFFGGFGPKK